MTLAVSSAPPAPETPAVAVLPAAPLHGAAATPIPHWLALTVAVLGLWVAVAAAVLVCDGLLARLGAAE